MTREERAKKIAFRLVCGEKVGGGDGGTYIAKAVRPDDLVRELLTFADAEAAAMRERAAFAAQNALVKHEWPPQDGDIQCDEVVDAIRALPTQEG